MLELANEEVNFQRGLSLRSLKVWHHNTCYHLFRSQIIQLTNAQLKHVAGWKLISIVMYCLIDFYCFYAIHINVFLLKIPDQVGNEELLLPPDHLIDNTGVALNQLDDLCTDVFVCISRNRYSIVSILYHLNGNVHCL